MIIANASDLIERFTALRERAKAAAETSNSAVSTTLNGQYNELARAANDLEGVQLRLLSPEDRPLPLQVFLGEVDFAVERISAGGGRQPEKDSDIAAGTSGEDEGLRSPHAPIFIVHGSDTRSAESVAYIVGAATGRKTIILRDQPNLGQALIEKFEKHAAEASYAIIILTPDDYGGRAGETDTRPRGRQNVIFEMGYFYGRIGRRNVSVLIRPGVEKPSDIDGIAYITFDDGAWKTELFRDLTHADIDVKL